MKTLSKILAMSAAIIGITTADNTDTEWLGATIGTVGTLMLTSYMTYFHGNDIKKFFSEP